MPRQFFHFHGGLEQFHLVIRSCTCVTFASATGHVRGMGTAEDCEYKETSLEKLHASKSLLRK